MKTLKYIFLLVLILGTAGACLVDDTEEYAANSTGYNLATFEKNSVNLTALANGDEYLMKVQVKLVGPTVREVTNDITVTVSADASSTAVEGVHYVINTPTVILKADNNYLANVEITLITEGNSPPEDGTPEQKLYKAPILNLNIVSATGDAKVTNSGKPGKLTLNFVRPNPFAGMYNAHLIYRHPNAGTYPDNIYVEEDNEKELLAITGRKCETGFATWFDTDLCWITVNPDNSITFEVDATTWPYTVVLGDPNDPTKISHFDPDTRIIYLYYHYQGTGGPRIFWEVFTPLF